MPADVGQRLYKVFTLVSSGDTSSLPTTCSDSKFDCDFKIPVFADGTDDDLKNDKRSFLYMGADWTTSIKFFIEKLVGSTWTEQDEVTDDTYGEYYGQGDFDSKLKYAGIVIYWKEILDAFGVGEYRIRYEEENDLGDKTSYSREFCLKVYGCSTDNTVRLEWTNTKGIGNIQNDKEVLDFGEIVWPQQVRIPMSFFGYPISTYETEEIQYQNGEFQDISNDQKEEYQLITGALPAWLHNEIKTLACQSGTLIVTDFSSNNPQEIIRKGVKLTSGYEPRWKKTNKCAPVTLKFKPQFNRLEIYKCLS